MCTLFYPCSPKDPLFRSVFSPPGSTLHNIAVAGQPSQNAVNDFSVAAVCTVVDEYCTMLDPQLRHSSNRCKYLSQPTVHLLDIEVLVQVTPTFGGYGSM
jgi:hypothetical protein